MSKIKKNSMENFFLRHCSLSIIAVNAVATLVITFIYIFIAPFLMNYSPLFDRVSKAYSIDYRIQIAAVVIFNIGITSLMLCYVLRSFNGWYKLLINRTSEGNEKLNKIKQKCMNLPYLIFIFQILLMIFSVCLFEILYFVLYHNSFTNFPKVLVIVYSLAVFEAVIVFIFTKINFTRALVRTYDNYDIKGKRINLKNKILMLLIPLFTAIVLTSIMAVYSCILDQRGYFIYKDYKAQLENKLTALQKVDNAGQMLFLLSNIKVNNSKLFDFVISPSGQTITSDGDDLGFYFTEYLKVVSNNPENRIYGKHSESNGAVIRIKAVNGYWIVGVKYILVTPVIIKNIFIVFFIMLFFGILVAFYISKAVSIDVLIPGKFLQNLAKKSRQHTVQRIPVTSNDEIGDLITAFNRIREQDMEYDKLKTEFITNISHELRTPLSVLLASIQLIEKSMTGKTTIETEKIDGQLGVMRQNCRRLLRLANNFIDISRVDSGYLQPRLKNCNVVSVIEETVISIVEYAKVQEIDICFDTEIEEKIMAIDPEIIERIILNLLSNAIKYAGKGSVIQVKIYDVTDHITLSVKDDGEGIPLDKQKIVFERFRQIENLLTRKREGSGIGLYLVKAFVELLGGNIALHSDKGTGCEFIINLPVKVLPEEYMNSYHDKSIAVNRMEKVDIEFSDIS